MMIGGWELFYYAIVLYPVCAIVLFGLAVYIATELLIRPSWYKDPVYGHQNRPESEGLPSEVIGRAKEFWRISPQINGLGTPASDLGIDLYHNITVPTIKSRCYLRGWYVPAPTKTTKCVIAIHGGGRDRRAYLRHVPFLRANDCSVVLFDLQEHGISDGKQRGIGWCTYEPENVLSVAKYVKDHLKYEKIILLGTSMGASAAIIATAVGDDYCRVNKKPPTSTDIQENRKNNIDAVIAENPFFNRYLLIDHLVRHTISNSAKSMIKYFLPLCSIIVRCGLWRLSANEYVNPADVIAKLNVPLLLMHGKNDAIIPFIHSELLYAGATGTLKKDLWLVENGEHTALYNVAREKWEEKVLHLIKLV